MQNFADAIKSLESLLWEFGLQDAITNIQTAPAEGAENPALICIVEKGNSSKLIATVFNEFDYFPKYVVIRERFAELHPSIDVKYLI